MTPNDLNVTMETVTIDGYGTSTQSSILSEALLVLVFGPWNKKHFSVLLNLDLIHLNI